MDNQALKIQKVFRGFLVRKKASIQLKKLEKIPDSNAKQNSSFIVNDDLGHKDSKKIKIENFVRLISQETFDSPDKIGLNVDPSSEASFRINLEDQSHSPTSFNQDPSLLMGSIPISPIIAVKLDNRNFTTESVTIKKPKKISSVKSVMNDEQNYKFDEFPDLLSPNLKKMKLNMYTPTFPVKSEDGNVSWDNIAVTFHHETEKNSVKQMNIDIPEYNELGTFFCQNRENIFKTFTEDSKNVQENDKNYVINILQDVPFAKEIAFGPLVEASRMINNKEFLNEKKSYDVVLNSDEYDKFNDTLFIGNNDSVIIKEALIEQPKQKGKKRLKSNASNPNFNSLAGKIRKNFRKSSDFIQNSIKTTKKNVFHKTTDSADIKLIQSPLKAKQISQTPLNSKLISSDFKELKIDHKRSTLKLLPKLKKSTSKTKPILNPYSSE